MSMRTMTAVRPPTGPSPRQHLIGALRVLALMILVTGIVVIAGAVLMSPLVSARQRLAVAAMATGVFVAGVTVAAAGQLFRNIRSRRRRHAIPAVGPTGTTRSRSRRASRTPQAIQSLAASGASKTEIAWKTGLPVDAVSMLLEISRPVSMAN